MKRQQRGVAMLTAIVLVALATIIAASVAFNNAMTSRRAASVLTFDQALLYVGGAEAVAAYALSEDRGNTDDGSENWARPYGPLEIVPGVWLEARIEDSTGRFNLNSLVDSNGDRDEEAIKIFERLLELLNLEPKWASMFADWIDKDLEPAFPEGGEDTLYSAQDPGYRPPNAPVTSVSELLALPGFNRDRDRYKELLPYVTALPRDASINTCTASGKLLDALTNQKSFSLIDLPKRRETSCFPTKADVANAMGTDPIKDWRYAERSNYFRLRSFVSIGTTEFALYSLLHRDGKKISSVLRTYGAD